METFVNDSVKITLNTNVDISAYSDLRIKYQKPDGTTGCWSASLCSSSNECIYYNCAIGDLDQSGVWLVQALIIDIGVRLTGLWAKFTVHSPLAIYCTTVPPTTATP